MINWLWKVFHRHKWEDAGEGLSPTGYVVPSWGLEPVREMRKEQFCIHCGVRREVRGLYDPNDKPKCNEHGWPVDLTGKTLPVNWDKISNTVPG